MCRSENFRWLRDEARDLTVNESSIIIEYLDQHFPGPTRFIPDDPALARQMRFRTASFRPLCPSAVAEGCPATFASRRASRTLMASRMRARRMQTGSACRTTRWLPRHGGRRRFYMADCSAAPSLFYHKVIPSPTRIRTRMRISIGDATAPYARALKEAEPYFKFFPEGVRRDVMPRQQSELIRSYSPPMNPVTAR